MVIPGVIFGMSLVVCLIVILGRGRRMDRQGEVLIWCRKCSGCARQRMGPTLMNCCKPEHVGTEWCGKMLKRIQILEDGRVRAKEAKNWKVEGQKRRIARKEYRRLWNEFEMGGFMAQKGLWNLARQRKCCRTEVHCLRKRSHCERVQGMHEENFLSSWLREDMEGKEERRMKAGKETRDEVSKTGKSVNTTPNLRIRPTPAHVIFLMAQDLSVVSHKISHSSHLAQHVTRALFVVSFTLEHYLTFHMHSSPTFCPTIYQTFIDDYFTLRFILRRSIECVFRSPG